MQAEELLRQGQLREALTALQQEVRSDPANAKLRVFLFQLLSVLGDWDRAMNQLNVAADMDAENLLMAQVCRPALNCEALRADIFAGRRSPLIFGEPPEWVGWMVQACHQAAAGQTASAARLRDRAFEAAPAVPGTLDGQPFEWLADADSRLGPILEAVIDGRYYWVPMSALRSVALEAPADLRDVVWVPARLTFANEGQAVALVPGRYPGTTDRDDPALLLGRKTEWVEPGDGLYFGLGQRVFATDAGEHPLLATRQIAFAPAADDAPGQGAH